MAPRRSGRIFFGVDARHIRQLGQELVGDRVTAVTELIKNAYDADATEVQLRFSGAEKAGGTLEVVDNGNGMTLEDLSRGWMRISTSDKDENPVSPKYRRSRAGRKGIGRFATETLGRKLQLSSTVRGTPVRLVIDFDWEHDFPAGRELAKVPNRYRLEDAPKKEHGTTLLITGLYDAWTDAQRQKVHQALLVLQPPFPVARVARSSKKDPGFRVEVKVDGQPSEETLSGYDEFISAATARVTITVGKSRAWAIVKSDVLDLNERIPLGRDVRLAGPFKAEAAYFVYSDEALGSIKLAVARRMGKIYGGIRVYRDGLRVMPYGDPKVDWLGLDAMQAGRSQTLAPIRNLHWFGQVLLTRKDNPGLRDTASREGLVQNAAYFQMQTLLLQGLVKAAERVTAERGRKVSTSDKPGPGSRKELLAKANDDVMHALREKLPPSVANQLSTVVSRALNVAEGQAAAADKEEQDYVESLVGEIELLRILASLGTSIAVFNHEVQSVLDGARADLLALQDVLEASSPSDDASEKLGDARRSLERLQDLAAYINAYVSVSRRRNRDPQPLYAVIENFVDQLSSSLARNVTIHWEVKPRTLRTEPMTQSELETTLINFLTNAIKAMDREGHRRREVLVTARGDRKWVVLRFEDTGVGVDPSIKDRIFEPFISDTRSAVNSLGLGTGLGLKIVADIAEAYDGEVELAEPSSGYTTCVELRLPRWREQVKT